MRKLTYTTQAAIWARLVRYTLKWQRAELQLFGVLYRLRKYPGLHGKGVGTGAYCMFYSEQSKIHHKCILPFRAYKSKGTINPGFRTCWYQLRFKFYLKSIDIFRCRMITVPKSK